MNCIIDFVYGFYFSCLIGQNFQIPILMHWLISLKIQCIIYYESLNTHSYYRILYCIFFMAEWAESFVLHVQICVQEEELISFLVLFLFRIRMLHTNQVVIERKEGIGLYACKCKALCLMQKKSFILIQVCLHVSKRVS